MASSVSQMKKQLSHNDVKTGRKVHSLMKVRDVDSSSTLKVKEMDLVRGNNNNNNNRNSVNNSNNVNMNSKNGINHNNSSNNNSRMTSIHNNNNPST